MQHVCELFDKRDAGNFSMDIQNLFNLNNVILRDNVNTQPAETFTFY